MGRLCARQPSESGLSGRRGPIGIAAKAPQMAGNFESWASKPKLLQNQ
jgi:hypothetical protein